MDNQDHRKNHATGHENHGSHVCHKCGWPFPNPHPSAKHRRAHKKVCGTLEGYKLTNPDEEKHSDDEHKGSGKSELGALRSNVSLKNGIQRRESSVSEDEVFADAVAEFGDTGTSPTIDAVVAKAAQNQNVNVKDVIQEREHPVQGSQLEMPQDLESAVDNLKNDNVQLQNDVSSSTVGTCLASSDKETEALVVDGREDRRDSASFISDVKPEGPVSLIPEISNTKLGDDVPDKSLMHSGQSFEGPQNEISYANGHFPHRVTSPGRPPSMEVSEVDSRLEQMNEFAGLTTDISTTRINDCVPMDRLVDSKEEQSNLSGPVTPQIDSSSNSSSEPMEVVGIEHADAIINIERDASAQDVGIAYPGETGDGRNVKAEPNEMIPALSTPTGIPAESHSDMTIEDCRDHGPATSDAQGEVIKEMEDHPIDLASEEDHSSFLFSKSDEGDACSAQRVIEENLQQEGTVSKSAVEKMFNECKTDVSECKAASRGDRSNGAEALPDALNSDVTAMHTGQTHSIEKQDDSNHDLSQEILPERPALIHETGRDATVSTGDNEVDRAGYAIGSNDFTEKATISRGNESNGSGALLDVLSSNTASMQTGLTQMVCPIEKQESHDSHHDLSHEIPPEKPTLMHETGSADMVFPADAEVDGTSDPISNSDFPEKAMISTGNGSNGLEALAESEILPEKSTITPEAGGDAVVSPADTKVDGASNAISSSSDFPEKAGTDNSNLAEKNIGEGVLEVHQGEDFQEVLKGVVINSSTDCSCLMKLGSQDEYIDTNIRVSEALHEDIKVDHDIAGLCPSGAENLRLNRHLASALNIESGVFGSVSVENNNASDIGGDVSDINSQSLQQGDHNLRHKLSSAAVVKRVFSVNSDGQTDHIEEEMVPSTINTTVSLFVTEEMVPSTINTTNEQGNLPAEFLQVPNFRAEEADFKKTLVEESNTDFGLDKFDMEFLPLQEKEGTVASTTNATDDLMILAADTLQDSDTQSQKANLKKAFNEESTAKDFGEHNLEIKSQPLQEGANDLLKRQPSASVVVPADVFVDSYSQTDSVEGHWGSVSDATFPSTRDANEESAIIATETLAMSDAGVKDKDQRPQLETKISTSERQRSGHSDIFEAPSFMTLVESGRGNDQPTASSEIQTVQNLQQPNSSPLQAGWFPSLTYDVKESEGRKKNEEIIAKVSNWSAGKPHTPLRSLLVEATLESKQKLPNAQEHPPTVASMHEASAEDNNIAPKTTLPETAPEASTALAAEDDQEKEWNTPARLPEIKKEKRKARGKWVPFVCCSTSVDLVQ